MWSAYEATESRMRAVWLLALLVGVVMPLTAACSGLGLHHQSAREVFKNPKVAALAEAGCAGNTKKMDALVKRGADVNATGLENGPVLLWVMFCKNYNGFEKLLELGANPNYKFNGEDSVTFIAAGADDPKWLALVLARGGNPSIWGSGPRSALMVAEQYSRVQNMQLLLDHGADVNAHDAGGNSIAVFLAGDENYDMLVEVLEHGYSYDLTSIARMLCNTKTAAGTEKARKKALVLGMLKMRGVKFPLPPLS